MKHINLITSGGTAARNPALRAAALFLADILIAGAALCVFAYFHHVMPRRLEPVGLQETEQTDAAPSDEADETSVLAGHEEKFIDGEPQWGADYYKSESVSVEITRHVLNPDDEDEIITYYVADIYIKNITKLRTALAEDTFGQQIVEHPLIMALSNGAVCAVNGDYYGSHSTHGVVIRNGVVYRLNPSNDVCIIGEDGVMRLYSEDYFESNMDQCISGAWQGWCFGPSLVVDGEKVKYFDSEIAGKNPRTAIGYYEPGHYCLVTIDGRQEGHSNGMTFSEMAELFAGMGCEQAYNLDGGKSSMMTFDDKIINSPYHDGRESSDIVYIGE